MLCVFKVNFSRRLNSKEIKIWLKYCSVLNTVFRCNTNYWRYNILGFWLGCFVKNLVPLVSFFLSFWSHKLIEKLLRNFEKNSNALDFGYNTNEQTKLRKTSHNAQNLTIPNLDCQSSICWRSVSFEHKVQHCTSLRWQPATLLIHLSLNLDVFVKQSGTVTNN